jgi:lysophospholipase L1-like esterase
LRSDEIYSKRRSPNSLRIICIGDSITFGYGLENKYSYPRLLEDNLSQKLPFTKVEVINAGVPGYSSRQGIVWFDQELGNYNPDIIIVQFGFNDAYFTKRSMLESHRYKTDNEIMKGSLGNFLKIDNCFNNKIDSLFSKLVIVNAVMAIQADYGWKMQASKTQNLHQSEMNFYSLKFKDPDLPKSRVNTSEFEINLNYFCDWAENNGAKLIFIDAWPTQLQYRKALEKIAKSRNRQTISQFNLILKIQKNPDHVLTQNRFANFARKTRFQFDKEFLDKNPEFYGLADYVHPNEIANIMLVENLDGVIIKNNLNYISSLLNN